MSPWLKKILVFAVRLLVSAFFIWFLLRSIPMDGVREVLGGGDWRWLVAILLLSEFSMWTQAVRWHRLILEVPERKPPVWDVFRYTAIGYFFNLMLPSGFGGDVVKSIGLGHRFQVMGASIAAMMVARVLGLVVLLLFFWIAFPLLGADQLSSQWIWAMLLGLVALGLGMFVMFNTDRLPWLKKWTKRYRRLEEVRGSLAAYRTERGLLVRSFLDSFLIQGLLVAIQWCMFRCVGVHAPWAAIFAVFPMVTLITLLPISIYGIGLREVTTVSLYCALTDIPKEMVLGAGLLGYVVVFFQALQGALFLALTKKWGRKTA